MVLYFSELPIPNYREDREYPYVLSWNNIDGPLQPACYECLFCLCHVSRTEYSTRREFSRDLNTGLCTDCIELAAWYGRELMCFAGWDGRDW